jgi:hypothetical protein
MADIERVLAQASPKTANYEFNLPADLITPDDMKDYIEGKQTRSVTISITHEQLAWALANSPEYYYRLILFKYCTGCPTDRSKLIDQVVKYANDMANKRDWRKRQFSEETFLLAIITAVDEVMNRQRCKTCNGLGKVLINVEGQGVQLFTCDDKYKGCGGVGYQRWTMRRRARELRIDESTFRKGGWKGRYMELYAMIYSWEYDAIKRIKIRLE